MEQRLDKIIALGVAEQLGWERATDFVGDLLYSGIPFSIQHFNFHFQGVEILERVRRVGVAGTDERRADAGRHDGAASISHLVPAFLFSASFQEHIEY